MKEFEFMLAPMEGITDPEFRELCYRKGADSTFTEMAMIAALSRNNQSTLEKIKITDAVPTYIQLIGANEDYLETFLKAFKPVPGFMGFNLNLGCPSPNMINKGFGSALMKRLSKVNRLVRIIKDHDYPVSIKLRLGMNNYEKKKKIYLNLINEVDADFYVVHAKHGKQAKSSLSDFSIYEGCVATGKVIIANGDIKTREHIKFLRSVGVRGAMIGRPAIKKPNIFKKLKKGDS